MLTKHYMILRLMEWNAEHVGVNVREQQVFHNSQSLRLT